LNFSATNLKLKTTICISFIDKNTVSDDL